MHKLTLGYNVPVYSGLRPRRQNRQLFQCPLLDKIKIDPPSRIKIKTNNNTRTTNIIDDEFGNKILGTLDNNLLYDQILLFFDKTNVLLHLPEEHGE